MLALNPMLNLLFVDENKSRTNDFVCQDGFGLAKAFLTKVDTGFDSIKT